MLASSFHLKKEESPQTAHFSSDIKQSIKTLSLKNTENVNMNSYQWVSRLSGSSYIIITPFYHQPVHNIDPVDHCQKWAEVLHLFYKAAFEPGLKSAT